MQPEKPFRKRFPWLRMLKLCGGLLLYVTISTIIFFSVEECLLPNTNKHAQKDTKSQVTKCVETSFDNYKSQNTKNETLFDSIVNCAQVVRQTPLPLPAKEKSCKFKAKNIMNWAYFAVFSLFGIGETSKHLYGQWSQMISWIFVLVGMTLNVRLYKWTGIVGVNLLNLLLKTIKEKFTKKCKPRQKYEILLLSIVLFFSYAILCAIVTTGFSEEKFSVSMIHMWIMILFSISDEMLLDRAFNQKTVDLIVPIILVSVGFMFTATVIAALINLKYRLTFKLTQKAHKKKEGLQGCFV